MKRRVGLAVLLAWLAVAPSIAASSESTDRLAEAAAAHPEDPDLAWLLARELADAGETEAAIDQLRALVRRWPERRPGVRLLLGRLLSSQGQDAEAIPHLEGAVAQQPTSGPARFHLGLALRAVGRLEDADAQFRFAAHYAPELASEALLLRALGRLERDDLETAHALLEETIAVDPDGDAAHGARLLLRQQLRERRYYGLEIDAHAGVQYEDNVRLESGAVPGVDIDGDFAATWGSAVTWDVPLPALSGEGSSRRFGFVTSAFYEGTDYREEDLFDGHDVGGSGSLRWNLSPRASLRFDGLYGHSFLDDRSYFQRTDLRPNFLFGFGEKAGVLRLWGNYAWVRYDDRPLFTSLERDGNSFGGGFEHFFQVPGLSEAWAGWYADWQRSETESEDDLLGFEGDFDHDRYRGGVRTRFALPFAFALQTNASLAAERYANDNLLEFLNRLQVGDLARAEPREDWVLDSSVVLSRPIFEPIELELRWSYLQRFSNADLYDYDRSIYGVAFRISTL
ncbi:MAG: tetratricopeptide repeat protein [Myxococcota bacterium]